MSNFPESYHEQSPVLVTGGTGYVAGWIIKKLLERGVTVHAAVRDPTNEKKLAHLTALETKRPDQLKFFKADLLVEGTFAEAMKGCKIVFHTASPFISSVNDPQKDLVDPAKLGTLNVLNTVNETESVTRVVLTSSVASMYGDNKDIENEPKKMITEDSWNTTSSLHYNPYPYSKTVAEKEAWKIAKAQSRWDMVTIHPSLVFGPGVAPHATSESFNIMKQFGDGLLCPGCPSLMLGIVDVRDVAEAHIRAGFTGAAKGRYIVCGNSVSLLEIGQALRPEFNAYPLPKFELPKFLVWAFGPMMSKTVLRKFLSLNVGYAFKADNSKGITELNLTYKPLKETVQGLFQQLIDTKQVKAR